MRKLSAVIVVAVVVVSTTASNIRVSRDLHSVVQLRAWAANANLVLSLIEVKLLGELRDHLRDLLFLSSRCGRRENVLRGRSRRLVLDCTY